MAHGAVPVTLRAERRAARIPLRAVGDDVAVFFSNGALRNSCDRYWKAGAGTVLMRGGKQTNDDSEYK